MRIRAILCVLVGCVIILLSGCFITANVKYEVYERQVTEEDGIIVNVDGMVYKTLPEQKWEGQKIGDFLGYAGEEKKNLYLCEGDDERNFIFIYDSVLCPKGSTHSILLYREDIPEPSAEFIDKLLLSEYINEDSEIKYSHDNTITDKSVIKRLFEEWNTKKRIADASHFDNESKLLIMQIYCLCDELPGVYYKIEIRHNNGNVVCGNNSEGYIKIPIELLEEIAGHDINAEELIKEYK